MKKKPTFQEEAEEVHKLSDELRKNTLSLIFQSTIFWIILSVLLIIIWIWYIRSY